jgi:dienelactone hydrolase
MVKRIALSVLALLLTAAAALILVPADSSGPFVVENFFVPASDYSIEVTVLRPKGLGPFGVVVLNHGVGATREERMLESPEPFLRSAAAFAERGYAVVMPLRRGFGATGGGYAESPGACGDPDFRHGERAASTDVLAAYQFAQKLPYVDPTRMILAGQSAGGVVSLYAASESPPGLQAVIAFAAGRGADAAGQPGVPCAAAALGALFADIGKSIKVPALLYYAENDLFFGPATARMWYGRLRQGAPGAELIVQPAFESNGHFVFTDPDGQRAWLPAVEDFLRRHHIGFDAPPRQQRI